MGVIIIGGGAIQLPLGRLSDIIGRRRVIFGACVAGVVVSVAASQYNDTDWYFYAIVAVIGAMATPLYSLCAAHTNDYLNKSQMVAASGTLVLVSGIGASMGPPLTTFAMEHYGPQAFFYSIAISLGLVAAYALWRATRRDAVAREDLGDFVVMAPTPTSASFNPDVVLEKNESATEADAQDVQASFEELVEELNNSDEKANP